ncbi:ArsR family transcriptional regulator [Haloterrigena sp. SYSU A558-1]|uniref:ArsR family transcriptional regulator n=1 Tax=Haloterrigena gelatinilytica TaxID=2741724 RepID=A0ABX2LGR2_9EURY|nr:ArsR family transcriptional regulator [Haloterrigena gelatinilytica]NUC71926.1 ArsR family transcriptional regulator [Haloterrigena gelatinilytica]
MASEDEEIIQILTDSINREILIALNGSPRGLSVTEIAGRLSSADGMELERTIVSLHHEYLPRLDEVGLVAYDHDENIVTAGYRSTDDADWMDVEALDELLSQFGTGRRSDERTVGRLEGREAVYEYCRDLADRADDELFLIYASDELLDEECLPYAEDAIERGVELHAGTKNRDAREFFRERLPEATIWDPQMDWMYEQANYPKVSRLIVVDRETVVVGLWEEDATGAKTEVAMIGEGRTNPLVVLTRELLGSRLDHLDYQSDEFLEGLPFET